MAKRTRYQTKRATLPTLPKAPGTKAKTNRPGSGAKSAKNLANTKKGLKAAGNLMLTASPVWGKAAKAIVKKLGGKTKTTAKSAKRKRPLTRNQILSGGRRRHG